jgi:hypothetical protein
MSGETFWLGVWFSHKDLKMGCKNQNWKHRPVINVTCLLTPLTLEVKPLSQTQTMECVHLKEQPERPQHIHTQAMHLYNEILEQVSYFKTIWQESKPSSASVPEVTSMQVCECIGEEWKSPTPDILGEAICCFLYTKTVTKIILQITEVLPLVIVCVNFSAVF